MLLQRDQQVLKQDMFYLNKTKIEIKVLSLKDILTHKEEERDICTGLSLGNNQKQYFLSHGGFEVRMIGQCMLLFFLMKMFFNENEIYCCQFYFILFVYN